MAEIATQIKEHLHEDISKEVTAQLATATSTYTLLLKEGEILLNTGLSNYSKAT
jgi:hypothetical protein